MIFGEEGSESQGPQPAKVRLDIAHMETVYANSFALAGGRDEVVLYVGTNLPMPNTKEPIVRISHRITLLPPNAKRLMLALRQTMKVHEDRFGPIELPPMRRPDPPQS